MYCMFDNNDNYNNNSNTNNNGNKYVDHQMTNQWLETARLKSETEGFIIAAQYQAIKTNYYPSKILKDGTDPMSRICGQFHQKPLTILWQGALSWPKLNTYTCRYNKAAMYTYTGTSTKS